MAHHAGYAADFEEFRRQGEIGFAPALLLNPAEPEIGHPVEIRVVGLAAGRVRCSNGEAWPVTRDSQHVVVADRRLQLHLMDEVGRVHAMATIEPRFDRPRMLGWALPAELSWFQEQWPVPEPAAEGAEHLGLAWREAGEQAWRPILAGERLAVPSRRATLELRAELRSRHAHLTPDAVIVVERQLQVVPPAPKVRACLPIGTLQCHSAQELAFEVRHVQQATLAVGDEVVAQVEGAGSLPAILRHVIQPHACGAIQVSVRLVDLDGRDHEGLALALEVKPRPVAVSVLQIAGTRWRVEVAGTARHVLRVPVADERFEQLPASFDLALNVDREVELEIDTIDDAGLPQTHRIELQPPALQWLPLPDWSTLPTPAWD